MESKIYKAMINVMNEVKAISKDNQTSGYASFKYRGIDDVYNALNPVMAKCGIFCIPELMERSREERTNKDGKFVAYVTVKVKYTFYADDGSSVSCITAGEGMDSGDKATSKALSIAMKYALFQTFCIPTEDMPDPDAETDHLAPKQKHQSSCVTKEQLEKIKAIFVKKGCDTPKKCQDELKTFFGKEITSKTMTKEEAEEYISACKTPDNPFM